MSDPEWKAKHSKIQKEVQSSPERRKANSIAQKKAQNRPEVKLAKSKSTLTYMSDPLIKDKHTKACNTKEFKEAQSKDKLGSKFVHNPITNETKRTKDFQKYLDDGWIFGYSQKKNR